MLIVKDMAATAVVAASASTRGIGWKGDIPWKLPGDMTHFKQLTQGDPTDNKINAVVMGRNTWESIPPKFRPLSGRTNVVLTRAGGAAAGEGESGASPYPPGVLVASSLEDAWMQLAQLDTLGHIFVIGGSQVYEQALKEKYVHKVVLTQIDTSPDMQFDTFFAELDSGEWVRVDEASSDSDEEEKKDPDSQPAPKIHRDEKSGLTYSYQTFVRPNREEEQYLDLIRDILATGIRKGDRTGTGTIAKFGARLQFDLRHGQLPLLTTKRTFWRGVAEELLWFISGSTNSNILSESGIKIWDGNGSREFLDQRGLSHREEGDLGPVYGFQWRHFGAKYVDMHTDYTGQGVDQLQNCIDAIKNNPNDRRIVMSAWNPADLDEMALPPCHMFCQFFVNTDTNELSCQMYQRSADCGLGVPFNIASYALLTHLIANVTGHKPGDFIHVMGDAHVYTNHVGPLQEQLTRTPRSFPKLFIKPSDQSRSIDDFSMDDLEVVGYYPHKTISMEMAV